MLNKGIELFVGLSIGYYLNPTISIFGIVIPWVLIVLITLLIIAVAKKLGTFLWKKLIQEIKKELL